MPMPLVKRALIALAAVLLIAAIPAFAQDAGARQQQPAASVASGELVKIDTSAKTIVIKTESDPQMQFSYTDATKITGADKGVAGLATMTGSSLTIRYTKKGEDNVATEIVVQPKKS
jgi:ABC-type amino acid transport substrate-binding protein